MPLNPDRPPQTPLTAPAGSVHVAMTIRTRSITQLAFELRRLAGRTEARAVAATQRSWLIKSQGAADRCRERVTEHESLALAARTVADALDDAARAPKGKDC